MKIVTPHNHGKRYKKRKINKKKVLGVICILSTLISIVSYSLQKEKSPNVQTEENIMNTAEEDYTNENIIKTEETINETIESDLPDKLGDYRVIGELVIEKINVKNFILEKTEDNSLNLSVTKFYGPSINEPGNFCITGHNYTKMLKRLSELKVGDVFYLIGKEKQTKVTYKIYNIYTCKPTDLNCLNQNEDGLREVTLITCNPGGLTRLICKAREV